MATPETAVGSRRPDRRAEFRNGDTELSTKVGGWKFQVVRQQVERTLEHGCRASGRDVVTGTGNSGPEVWR